MSAPRIAIIINSFNRLGLLKQCLSTLSESISQSESATDFVAVVYDAGSTDGSREWLDKENEKFSFKVEIISSENGADTSFSAGINSAVAYAEEKFNQLHYLLFYETDNQILKFDPLFQAINQLRSRKELAACGFTVRHHDGSPAGVGQPFPSLVNFSLGKNIVSHLNLEAIPYRWERNLQGVEFSEVDVVYTSPLLVKLDAWKDSGGFDARTFPFSDCDIDWARRLRKKGWKMGVIKSSEVIHDNLNVTSAWSKMRAIHSHRGRLRYFRKHRPFAVFAVWPVFLVLRHIMELISIKIVVKEHNRQIQLSSQFWNLLKSCPKSYE